MYGIFAFFVSMAVLPLPIAAVNQGGWGLITTLVLCCLAGIITYVRVDLKGQVNFRQAAVWIACVFGGGILTFLTLLGVLFLTIR